MEYRLLFVLFVIFLYSGLTQAQILRSDFKKNFSSTAEQWQVTDIIFKAKIQSDQNPFDVSFKATFSGPESGTLQVPGFYNGGGEWVLRFSSKQKESFTFITSSSVPALSGLTGRIVVVENKRPDQKGAMGIDPDNRQAFRYEDGTSCFLLAFELDWLFALDYDNGSAIPKTEALLSQVKANGFNHVVMNVYAYDVGWKIADDVPEAYFYGKPSYSVFGGTNDNPDFSTLNTKLFRNLDRVIAHMQTLGLDAHLMIYVWNKKVNWPDMYSKADNRYFDYVIDRYQAFSNVVWDVSKEALDYGRCDIPYINERISRIRMRDAYSRLVTVHDYEYNSRESARVDFISIQSWRSNLYSLMLQAREIHANKPVVNIEHGGYENGPYVSFRGNYTSPETCLVRAYECVFAGVYGSYYWQDAAWNIVIHDPFDDKHNFEPPRFDYYKHFNDLFTKFDYNELMPSYPKLTTNSREGKNNLATNGLALSNGKGIYLMMVPRETEFINLVFQKPASGKFDVTWFNPFTGEYKNHGVADWTGWNEYINPWKDQMSILILNGSL